MQMGNLALLVAADIDRMNLPDPAVLSVEGYADTVNVQFSGQDAVSTDALGDRYGLSLILPDDRYHAPTLRTWRGEVELGGIKVTAQVYCGVEKGDG